MLTHTPDALVAFDLETTGLEPGRHGIVAMAAETEDGQRFRRLVIPEPHIELDPAALAKNGYNRQRWEEWGAVDLETAMRDLQVWLFERYRFTRITPLAHGATFDRGFLDWAQNITGTRLKLDRRWECSQATYAFLMRAGILPKDSASLDSLGLASGYWVDHPRDSEHQADEDAACCMASYKWLMDVAAHHRRTFWQRLVYLFTGR